MPASYDPITILNSARRAVPSVNYALGVAGVAAAGALIIALLGNGHGAVVILGGTFVAMVLLFVFARLVSGKNLAIAQAGTILVWAVTILFCIFGALTSTAFMFAWPTTWASVLGVGGSLAAPVASRDFVLGKWRAFQAPGDGTSMESVIDYRSDGTCDAELNTFLSNDNGKKFHPSSCNWQFGRISDSTFRLTVSYPGYAMLDGTSEYEIISRDRVRHISTGLGGDYTAERLK